ncbi:hypothetical protein ACNOYE_24720 [Nannocystaceae bacterium ST9]
MTTISERSPARSRAAWPALLLGLLAACPSRDRDYDLRTPSDVPNGRPSGCVDTPFLGPDPYNASRGIDCSPRSSRTNVTMLRGKVVAEALAGLPGPGLEGMLVTIHPHEGTPVPGRLPKQLGEATTDAQGTFVISVVLDAGTYVIAVRPAVDQAAVTIQQIEVAGRDSQRELLLLVPIDPELRERAEAREAELPERPELPEPPPPNVDPPAPEPKREGPEPPPPVLPRPTPP